MTPAGPHQWRCHIKPGVTHPFRRDLNGHSLPGFACRPLGVELSVSPPHPQAEDFAPFSLGVSLWPHQQEDAQCMRLGSWGEWAEVGLGKTVTVLAAFAMLRDDGGPKRLLVLGPESARHAWTGKTGDSNLFGLSSAVVTDKVKKNGLPSVDVLFCTYDKIFRQPYQGLLLQLVKAGVALCCDEVHMCTGLTSKRFQVLDLWARLCKYRWLLSGTPISNYPDKLWAVWRLLTGNECSIEQWMAWFCPGGVWDTYRLRELGKYLRCVSRVRTRREVAPHLPPTVCRVVEVPLTGLQRKRYQELIEAEYVDAEWLAALSHMLGVCSHTDLTSSNALLSQAESKLETLLELLGGMAGKVVIWSWHPSTLEWLAGKLPGRSVQYHGRVAPRAREEAVRAFNQDADCRFFLGNPAAAGAGLNLPAGDVRIYWDVGWKPVEYTQSQGRIERGLSYSPKLEYRLVAKGTIEAYVWEAVQAKLDLAALILEGKQKPSQQRDGIRKRWKLEG